MTTQQRAGSRTHPELLGRIKELARDARSLTAAQIRTALNSDHRFKGMKIPDVRTIQRIVAEERRGKNLEPWSLSDSEPDDARLVLEVQGLELEIWLRSSMEPEKNLWQPFESKPVLSKEEAKWIIRIRKAVPDIPVGIVKILAGIYMACEGQEDVLGVLDDMLALKPWKPRRGMLFASYVREIRKSTSMSEGDMFLLITILGEEYLSEYERSED